MIEIVAFAC